MRLTHSNLIIVLGAILVAVPPLWAFYTIASYESVAPHLDDWAVSIPLVIKVKEGTLTFADITNQFFQQRLWIPNLCTVILAYLGIWSLKAEMYVSYSILFVVLCLLVSFYEKKYAKLALVVVLSFVVFTLRQKYNLLYGFQKQYYFPVLFFILSLWAIKKDRIVTEVLAILFACLSMFSFLTGVMCWPVLILYRITSSSSRKYIYSAIWILACAASVLLFLHNYRIKETPSFGEFEGLWDIVTSFFHYWFAYIGAIFVYPKIPSVFPAIYIGIAALSVLAVFAWQVISKGKLIDTDVMEVYRTFFAISLFSLLSGALIALGRMKTLDIAPIHPLFGIYIPFSLLFWASLFVIAWLYFWDNHLSEIRLAKYAAVVASICIGVFYLKSYGEAASIPPPVTPQTNDCFKAWPETGVIDCFSHVLHDRSYERSGAILQKMKEHSIIY